MEAFWILGFYLKETFSGEPPNRKIRIGLCMTEKLNFIA